MKIFITGGLGFVGSAIAHNLSNAGSEVTVVARSLKRSTFSGNVHIIQADTSVAGEWQGICAQHNVVINLAGTTIFARWTRRRKNEIYDSRINTTRNIVDAIAASGRKIDLFSTSAVGYYGSHGDEMIDEGSGAGNDFLARVCRSWEEEALRAERYGSRVVLCRFGVVLGKNGGSFAQLQSLFSKHLGSVLGSGTQWFSWIHMDDLLHIYDFLFRHPGIAGPVNFAAPNPIQNRELTAAMAKALGKKVLFPPVPSFVLRILMGEFGDFLVKGQRVFPSKIISEGYRFLFPEIFEALKNLSERS